MTLTRPDNLRIELPLDAIAELCLRHGVGEMAVFGSALRKDFGPNSDVDFLVRFIDNDAGPWMEKFQELEKSLGTLLGRKVDVVSWSGIEKSGNPYRRSHILNHARLIYAA